MSVSILFADDHPIVRHGLRALLEAEPDFRVIGEVDDGLEAVVQAEQLQPDVLLLDLMMPGLNGLDVALQVGQRCPRTRVLVLSMYADEAYVHQALRNGVQGYVLKKSTPADLVRAIREVVAGRPFLSHPLSVLAIESYRQRACEVPLDPYEQLTNREREVLHLAAEGYTSAEIAARLCISPRTAEKHRGNLMRKLDLSGHADLLRFAFRRGILSVEDDL